MKLEELTAFAVSAIQRRLSTLNILTKERGIKSIPTDYPSRFPISQAEIILGDGTFLAITLQQGHIGWENDPLPPHTVEELEKIIINLEAHLAETRRMLKYAKNAEEKQ